MNVQKLLSHTDIIVVEQPCSPSPCGPNSHCRASNGQAICACVAGFKGVPPSCRPECLISADCARNRACSNQKCTDPCLGACGLAAQCTVVNHNPICSCPSLYTGDPFVRCTLQRKKLRVVAKNDFSNARDDDDNSLPVNCSGRTTTATDRPLSTLTLRPERSMPGC